MARPPIRLRPEIEAHPLWPEILTAYEDHRDLDVSSMVGQARQDYCEHIEALIEIANKREALISALTGDWTNV